MMLIKAEKILVILLSQPQYQQTDKKGEGTSNGVNYICKDICDATDRSQRCSKIRKQRDEGTFNDVERGSEDFVDILDIGVTIAVRAFL